MTKENLIFFCDKSIEISLYILIFGIPFSRGIVESAAITAIFIWLLKKFFTKSLFISTPLNWQILIYLIICILSTIFSTNIPLSIRTFIRKTIEYVLLYYIVVDTVKDRRILRNIILVSFVITGLVGIDGIFQYFKGWDFFRGHTIIVKPRVSGPFVYPNDFGGYLVTLIPLYLGLIFSKIKTSIKLILVIFLIPILVSLVFTISKSAWLAFIISIFVGALLVRRKYIILIPVIILILICIFSKPDSLLKSRLKNLFNPSEGGGRDREMLWQGGWEMFKARPVLGQGLGTYMYNFQKFRPNGYPESWDISYPHNCFLQMTAEIGIFGLLAFFWMIGSILIYAFRGLLRLKEQTFLHGTLWGLSLGLIGYLVHSFFDTDLYSLPLAVLFWVTLGLIVSTIKIIETNYF